MEKTYHVTPASAYTEDMAAQIGVMMPSLSSKATPDPIPRYVIEDIINSTDMDLLLAVDSDDSSKIAGVAVVSLTRGVILKAGIPNRKAWLEDFVVGVPRQGIGTLLWDAIIAWAKDRKANVLHFTSSPKKEGAHRFYSSKPATRIRAEGETAYFTVELTEIP